MEDKLFTPGPVNCSAAVKEAMLRDRTVFEFRDTFSFIRSEVLQLAEVSEDHFTCILLQGTGTYAVEAALRTAVPSNTNRTVLVLDNGVYGNRLKRICDIAGISNDVLSFPEGQPICLDKVREILQSECKFDAVAVVHCETTSGIINPITEIGQMVKSHLPLASFIVDAMSTFGAVPIDIQGSQIDFMITSANKCLQAVPGLALIIANKAKLARCKGNCNVLSLDLVDQYEYFEATRHFRFTPPTHAILALEQAVLELKTEGGVAARAKRYAENCQVLRKTMKDLGFKLFLREDLAEEGYIVTSYRYLEHENFCWTEFHKRLSNMGQKLYPVKVTTADCFRISSIGNLYPEDFERLLKCITQVLQDMNVAV